MVLSARGARNLDEFDFQWSGNKVEDEGVKARIRWKALKVHAESFLSATVLTVAFVILPE